MIKNKRTKKLLFPAIMVMTASLGVNTVFADSGHPMLKNNENPINSAVQSAKKVVSDTAITAAIKTKYAKSNMLNVVDIKVITSQGNVRLTGKLDSDMQYEEAVMLAESVAGVKNVIADQLEVKNSQQPLKDTYITAKVKGQLLKEKLMGENVQVWPVSVETKNGVVYLVGKVDSTAQRNNILKAVKTVEGVQSVKSKIVISSEQTNGQSSSDYEQ